jgi:hypothetical protein
MTTTATTNPNPVTIDSLKNIVKDPAAVAYMQNVFNCTAYAMTVRDIIYPEQQKIIDFFKFEIAPEWRERDQRHGREERIYIDKPENMYLCSENDFNIYFKELNLMYERVNLKPSQPDFCPLLEAESLQRDAERAAIEYICPLLNFDPEQVFYSLKTYKSILDILKGLFAPVVKNNLKK